jgi:hypothetical protein
VCAAKRAFILICLAVFALPGLVLAAMPALIVTNNQLTTSQGTVVHLQGVNIPSLEWGQGEHLFDSLNVALDWGANIVRLPLCQDRWFGRTWEKKDGGEQYRNTVHKFVAKAAAKNCYVILDLHWSDAGVWGENMAQHNMPDQNSAEFWADVSASFANDPSVLFSLYNEPHDVSWETWRNGGQVTETTRRSPDEKLEYTTPGMQKLLDTCREHGAKNVIVAGGLDWAYNLTGIADGHALNDPKGNGVVYDSHLYPQKKWFTHGDKKSQDWDRIVLAGGAKFPVLIGEFGNGKDDYQKQVIDFANAHNLPWIAWSLHPGARPVLIQDWQYKPTEFGQEVKDALRLATSRRQQPAASGSATDPK